MKGMQELMFLDMKILYGVFREMGLVEEYEIFMKICKRVRKMYLLAYSAINDKKAYEFVLNSCIYLVIVLIQRLNLNNTTLKED